MTWSGSFSLAVRELTRRSGRFLVLAAAVSVLVFFLLFQQGLLSGLVTQFVGAIRNQDSDVLVYSDQSRRNLQASVVAPEAVDAVTEVEGVAAAGPVGTGTFTVDTSVERTDAQLFGYDLDGPGGPRAIEEGRAAAAPGEAVADAGAGAGFEVGDTVTVVGGGPELTIVGTGRDLAFSVTPTLFTDFETYAEARIAQNPDATAVPPSGVAVRVEDGADVDAVIDAVAEAVPGVDPLTRAQAEAEAPGVAAVQQSFSLILVLGYAVVAVVVGFFFLILTTQKSDQLTLLRALGAPRGSLTAVVLVQVAAITAVALLVGGGLSTWLLSTGAGGIEVDVSASQLAGSALVVVALALVATSATLRRIRRLDPARAVDLGSSL
jgi:putative ABC transport system permease protein